jgi:hypothetical protein
VQEKIKMKKLLLFASVAAFAALLAFAFVACEGDDTDKTTLQIRNESSLEISQVVYSGVFFAREDSDIIGTWTGEAVNGSARVTLTLNIADNNAWTGVSRGNSRYARSGQGSWVRTGDSLVLNNPSSDTFAIRSGTAILVGKVLTGNIRIFDGAFTFAGLKSENVRIVPASITMGNRVTCGVEAGIGYIFFRVGRTNYRTSQLITVEKNEEVVFTFTDNILVVNVDNPGAPVTLGSLGANTIYIIGDTGPGGGTVFFASGGEYKEYSAELGSLSWSAANAVAGAHRGGGFTNWRLPDSGEATQVVAHIGRAIAGTFLYWTSSIHSSGAYWGAGFDSFVGTNPPISEGRHNSALLRTRAVRTFTN